VRARLWTMKEAVLKLSGDGLSVDPRELSVRWSAAGASALLSWSTATLDPAQVRFVPFEAGPGLVGTLAVLGGTPRVTVF